MKQNNGYLKTAIILALGATVSGCVTRVVEQPAETITINAARATLPAVAEYIWVEPMVDSV